MLKTRLTTLNDKKIKKQWVRIMLTIVVGVAVAGVRYNRFFVSGSAFEIATFFLDNPRYGALITDVQAEK